jgi:hypothetical protein
LQKEPFWQEAEEEASTFDDGQVASIKDAKLGEQGLEQLATQRQQDKGAAW